MKKTLPLIVAIALTVSSCKTPAPAPPPTPGASVLLNTRNNTCSLLYSLMEDEKDVSFLRFIKRENTDIKELIIKISSTAKEAGKMLKGFAGKDPSLILDASDLPPGELATRAAIRKTREKKLLSRKGKEFEETLLLSQNEALSYGWHLAKVAAENEPQPDRARALSALSDQLRGLGEEAYGLLLAGPK